MSNLIDSNFDLFMYFIEGTRFVSYEYMKSSSFQLGLNFLRNCDATSVSKCEAARYH